MRVVIVAIVALAGCYRPTIANCQYACDNNTCPSGLVCSAGMCVGAIGESCAPGDAGDDAGGHDVNLGEAGCSFGFPVSNIDPCSFQGAIGDWVVTGNSSFDTVSGTGAGDQPPAGSINTVQEGGSTVVDVVYVHTLQVNASATLTITGSRPLLIFADDLVTISGAVDFSATSIACAGTADRQGQPGMNGTGTAGGGGGGGGSYGFISIFATVAGARGGDGGSTADPAGNGGDGGNPTQDDSLVPLLAGCPGGPGGSGAGQLGAAGGFGGGALQISARNSIGVATGGQIRASGGGGKSNSTNAPGGGGGGAGGAILLEAPMVNINGFLCANGGGGGSTSGGTGAGEQGHCANTVAKGSTTGGISGGDGEANEFSAVVGASGETGLGGGGAGGGVGIIRINGTISGSGDASPTVISTP